MFNFEGIDAVANSGFHNSKVGGSIPPPATNKSTTYAC
jgi:hypothetical protein